jgi:NodT family efflux transporter outer membrane factor (OMF) lipoprotein
MSPLRLRAAAAPLALLCLAACDLGPDYQRPEIAAPAAWSSAADGAAAWPSADWWQGFASPRLDQLESQARGANDDLAAAIARVRQADAQARIAGAPLLPAVDATFSASRARAPGSLGYSTGNDFNPLLNASYELDFWGKNRAALRAAEGLADASRYDRATVELTVMSAVAGSYFQALALRERLQIAQGNYDTARSLLEGLRRQQQAGLVTALDVAQQATAAATLYAAIPPLQQQLRQSQDALAILVGAMPESLELGPGTLGELAQPQVQPGLPSELLARRPDVANAEAQLIAANANIAAARAAFFPSISLTAGGGYESSDLGKLFNPGSAVFSLAGALAQPIFEGGALQGQSELAQAKYGELLADYHKAVIGAFGNVEDALSGVRQAAEQERRQQDATDAAQHAYEFAQAQLHAGTINVLALLNTESALFGARDALAQARFAHLQALVNLYNALGGGWQQAPQPS